MEGQRKKAIIRYLQEVRASFLPRHKLYQKDFIASTALSNDVLAQETSEVLDYLLLNVS
jgi:hypothetical protein